MLVKAKGLLGMLCHMQILENRTIKDGDIAPGKDLNKDKKEIAIFGYGDDRQALAFYLCQHSRRRRSGRAYVEYVADMKVADTLWTSTNSLLTSTDSRRTSTDSLLILY